MKLHKIFFVFALLHANLGYCPYRLYDLPVMKDGQMEGYLHPRIGIDCYWDFGLFGEPSMNKEEISPGECDMVWGCTHVKGFIRDIEIDGLPRKEMCARWTTTCNDSASVHKLAGDDGFIGCIPVPLPPPPDPFCDKVTGGILPRAVYVNSSEYNAANAQKVSYFNPKIKIILGRNQKHCSSKETNKTINVSGASSCPQGLHETGESKESFSAILGESEKKNYTTSGGVSFVYGARSEGNQICAYAAKNGKNIQQIGCHDKLSMPKPKIAVGGYAQDPKLNVAFDGDPTRKIFSVSPGYKEIYGTNYQVFRTKMKSAKMSNICEDGSDSVSSLCSDNTKPNEKGICLDKKPPQPKCNGGNSNAFTTYDIKKVPMCLESKGYKKEIYCRDGSDFDPKTKKCKYGDETYVRCVDKDGKKTMPVESFADDVKGDIICLSGWKGENGFGDYVIERSGQIIPFTRNGKVLKPAEVKSGRITVYGGKDRPKRTLDSFNQKELDNAYASGKNWRFYDSDAKEDMYLYGYDKHQSLSYGSETAFITEWGEPLFLTDDEISEKSYRAKNPLEQGLCVNLHK